MAGRNYKIRINVKPTTGKRWRAQVALSDEAVALFDKPYVSVKRMQDRLAFCQWDNKTGQGMSVLNNNILQFGVLEDCEKMKDFCGEYNLVTKTDSGIVFVKLADRKPFTISYDREHTPHDKCTELPPDTRLDSVENPIGLYEAGNVPSLKELLGEKIEEGEKQLKEIRAEIERLMKEYIEPMQEKADNLNDEIRAYCKAYNYMRDGE